MRCILSVISSSLSFAIDRDESHLEHDTYDIVLQCARGNEAAGNDLTFEEKQSILKNRRRRLALSRVLAAVWEVQPKSIEVRSTIMTKQGLKTHIVHSLPKAELVASDMSPRFIVREILEERAQDIAQIFCEHFAFEAVFRASFHDRIAKRKGAMADATASSTCKAGMMRCRIRSGGICRGTRTEISAKTLIRGFIRECFAKLPDELYQLVYTFHGSPQIHALDSTLVAVARLAMSASALQASLCHQLQPTALLCRLRPHHQRICARVQSLSVRTTHKGDAI